MNNFLTKIIVSVLLLFQVGTLNAYAENLPDSQENEVIGTAYASDIVADIDGMKIPSYTVDGKTAIMVNDLKPYGFEVILEEQGPKGEPIVYITTLDKPSKPPAYTKPTTKNGNIAGNLLSSNTVVYVNGFLVPSYNIDGSTAISFEDLGYMGSTLDAKGDEYNNLNSTLGFSNYRFNYTFNKKTNTISLNSLRLGVPILMYHHVLTDEEIPADTENDFVVSLENFSAQMKYLYDHGYSTVTQEQMVDYLYNHGHLPAKSVMLTFDDGYYSNSHYAYPILKEYGFTAVVYTITSLIPKVDTETFDHIILQFMNYAELARCKDVFQYDSHTNNLHYLTPEGKSALVSSSEKEITDDLQQSLSNPYIENVSFAYPYGKHSDTVTKVLKDAGIKFAVTTDIGLVKPNSNPYTLPRYTIDRTMSMDKFIDIVSQNDERLQK